MLLKTPIRIVLVIAVSGGLTLGFSATRPGTPEDERAVHAVIATWDKAWNAHDVRALVDLHDDDAQTVNRFGRFLKQTGA